MRLAVAVHQLTTVSTSDAPPIVTRGLLPLRTSDTCGHARASLDSVGATSIGDRIVALAYVPAVQVG